MSETKQAPRELYLYAHRAYMGHAATVYEAVVSGHEWPQTLEVIEKSAYQELVHMHQKVVQERDDAEIKYAKLRARIKDLEDGHA